MAFLEGGLLPIISLTSLHFFIKYEDNKNEVEPKTEEKIIEGDVIKETPIEVVVEKEVPVEVIKEVLVEKEVPVEVIKEVPVEKIVEVPVKYFVNDEGEIYDENGHHINPETITTTTVDDGVRRLTYTKPS